jgi:hypothetical protein
MRKDIIAWCVVIGLVFLGCSVDTPTHPSPTEPCAVLGTAPSCIPSATETGTLNLHPLSPFGDEVWQTRIMPASMSEDAYDVIGADRWRLVSVADGRAYFQRRIR